MARSLLALRPLTDGLRPRRLLTAALDLLLPPACVLCAAPVDAAGLLCAECFGGLHFLGEPCCQCCGTPFELAWHAMEGGLCQRCLDAPPFFERARAAMSYDAASRRLVLPFKHADRVEYAGLLARLMARAGAQLLRDCQIIVPVPLHRRRLFVRRYNQAALLARSLSAMSDRPAQPDALRRIAATESLGGKSASERREEVVGAFAVRPRRAAGLMGRRILVVDDVMTSGATVNECAACLLDAGASAVDVLVAARVPDPRLGQGGTRRHRRRRRFTRESGSVSPVLGRTRRRRVQGNGPDSSMDTATDAATSASANSSGIS
jgi:ComF family protein